MDVLEVVLSFSLPIAKHFFSKELGIVVGFHVSRISVRLVASPQSHMQTAIKWVES